MSVKFWAYNIKFKGAGDSEDGNRVVDVLHFDKEGDPGHEEPEPGQQRFKCVDLDTVIGQVAKMQQGEVDTDDESELVLAESNEDEVDPKEFVQQKVASHHEMKVEGGGYGCSCGGWHYNTTGDSSGAIARAVYNFKLHKRQHRLRRVRENDEDFIDPKSFVNQVSRPTEKGCPECHGHNISEPDFENLVDCFDCGIWFNPAHPANLGESDEEAVDPKAFIEQQNYKIRFGVGAQTKYLKMRDNPHGVDRWVEDPFGATKFSHGQAVQKAEQLRNSAGPMNTVRVEMCESEDRARADAALALMAKFPGVGAHGVVVPAAGTGAVVESGPFEDDGLPGEASSFLRTVRSKRKKAKLKPII